MENQDNTQTHVHIHKLGKGAIAGIVIACIIFIIIIIPIIIFATIFGGITNLFKGAINTSNKQLKQQEQEQQQAEMNGGTVSIDNPNNIQNQSSINGLNKIP